MKDIAYTLWKEPEGWVIQCLFTGVTTCGETSEEAIKKLPEAVELYLSDRPEEDFPRNYWQIWGLKLCELSLFIHSFSRVLIFVPMSSFLRRQESSPITFRIDLEFS